VGCIIGASDSPVGSPYLLEVVKGNVPGSSFVRKYGRNEVVGTTELVVWDGGATPITYPQAASTISVVSSAAADAQNGAGFDQLFLQGLDGNWVLQDEILGLHATDGTIAVTSAKSYLRLFRSFGMGMGSGFVHATDFPGFNIGDITCTHSGDLMATIGAGNGQTFMAVYTVPAGMVAYMKSLWVSVLRASGSSAKGIDVTFLQANPITGTSQRQSSAGALNTGGSPFEIPMYDQPIPEKTDICLMVSASSSGTDVSGRMNFLLEAA